MAKKTGTKKAKKQAAEKMPPAHKSKVARATAEKPVKPETPKTPDAPPKPGGADEIVVFALRLRRTERDLIHKAAGSGKASQFVRGLAVAAAQGDLKKVQVIMQAIK